MRNFRVGDLAVYPAHGVGIVEAIENKEISGRSQEFFILRILDNDMTILIPTQNTGSVGLRAVIPKRQVSKIFEILKEKKVEIESQTWNRRYRGYMDKIKTGSVYEIARVLRDLFILKVEKDLSFGERKMLDTARNLLIKELSIVNKVAEEKIEEDIRAIFEN